MLKRLAGLAVIAAFAAAPAFAADKVFTSTLSGNVESSQTGSKATASAEIVVHVDTQKIDMTIDVVGLKTADLWDVLVGAPVGPIHLHNYRDDGDVVLVLPAPYGPSYADTANGFSVHVTDYDYTAGATLLKSTLTFDGFLKAMASGTVVLNIHTDKFTDGEISGTVVEKA